MPDDHLLAGTPLTPHQQLLDRAARVARWTDLGLLDPIVGFVLPGVGDALGALIGLYIVHAAWKLHAPRALLARMLLNLAVDVGLGLVPLVGDVADLLHRANARNVELLRQRLHDGQLQARPRDTLVLVGAALALVVVLALPVVLVVAAIAALR